MCECVYVARTIGSIVLDEGRASEGEEANGHTHLLSLLLPVATEDIGAERDTKHPPSERERERKEREEGVTQERKCVYCETEAYSLENMYVIGFRVFWTSFFQGSHREAQCLRYSGEEDHPLFYHDNRRSSQTLSGGGVQKTNSEVQIKDKKRLNCCDFLKAETIRFQISDQYILVPDHRIMVSISLLQKHKWFRRQFQFSNIIYCLLILKL